jgi:haloacetate dehalogenase
VIESVLFPGFLVEDISTTGATIRTLRGGSGQPLLLLHGYPQTHVIWHKIARYLTDRFTVVLTDLRGYGDSSKPEGGARHVNYSFRAMAQDQFDAMRHLGYERFYVGFSRPRGQNSSPTVLRSPRGSPQSLLLGDCADSAHVLGYVEGIRHQVHVVVLSYPESPIA